MKEYGVMMIARAIINIVVWFMAVLHFDELIKNKPKKEKTWYYILLVAVFSVWLLGEIHLR